MGRPQRYIHVPYAWRAAIDEGAPEPTQFYVGLVRQALEYGMPARRFGGLTAWVLRHANPLLPLGSIVRLLPAHRRSDLDAIKGEVCQQWEMVTAGLDVSGSPPRGLSLLALERSAGQTIFVFTRRDGLVLVCKRARRSVEPLEREASALQKAEAAGIAPSYIGRFGTMHMQEGLEGSPLSLRPIGPNDASSLGPNAQIVAAWSGLRRLALTTRQSTRPDDTLVRPVQLALRYPKLPRTTRSRLATAVEAVQHLDISVLQHGDASAQNTIFHGERFLGLVDWERTIDRGIPGFDSLNLTLAYLEHGIGLRRWSAEIVIESFRRAWPSSPLIGRAREFAAELARDVGVDSSLVPQLEVAFFARRLGRRMMERGFATGPQVAAAMLERVCES